MAKHVKPAPFIDAEGRENGTQLVRDLEAGDFLPDEGRMVPETPYWARRIRDGSVVVTESAGDEEPGRAPGQRQLTE